MGTPVGVFSFIKRRIMKNPEFKVNTKLCSGDVKIDEYITNLETELLHTETSAIHKFIINSNQVASVLSDDLGRLARGEVNTCVLIKDDKDDKRLERILNVIKQTEIFEQIAKIAEGLTPEVINEAQDFKIDSSKNVFEEIQKSLKTKKK